MARLNLKAIEERIKPLAGREAYDKQFLFDLLLAYGRSKSSITRLRTGSLNVAEDPENEVAQKNVVYFRYTDGDLLESLEQLRVSPLVTKFTPRFVIVSDYVQLIAYDTKTAENRTFNLREIDQHFTFFLPWAGMEKAQYTAESHADVKAAEKMGKLFDELASANPGLLDNPDNRHGLNVFFTRLLFCYFAEDTGIFEENQFTNAVGSHTLEDGSDTAEFIKELFTALDEADASRKPAHLADFPYVNGRLFRTDSALTVPRFSAKAREMLIELGKQIWLDINPDIFGSMFQAIVTPGKRSNLGQHYTSVPNILKTIEPLFLDGLREEFEKAYDSPKKLEALLVRIGRIKVFDPACGSGNFLVIAYKELRRLEHSILQRQTELEGTVKLFDKSRINIENFFGIEIDDFAVEVAILSLWIAKHQMNQELQKLFGVEIPLIPLKETGHIHAGNATRIDWNDVCPNNGTDEIYLIGNPPYGGSKKLAKEQKEDYPFVFGERPYSKNLDYIALWFVKGTDYIAGTNAQLAFVSTNSVVQGEHVALMFPMIFEAGVEIGFAYTSFKWENNAKGNAGVTVVVIGLRTDSTAPKYIYQDELRNSANHINGYLADANNIFITRRNAPLVSAFPKMAFSSMPRDGGNLILSTNECETLVSHAKTSIPLIKKYVGASDLINGEERYCLWIDDELEPIARSIPEINQRLERVARSRAESKAQSTAKFAALPHLFVQRAYKPTDSIIVPRVSSERREYIPMGYLGPDTVISDSAFALYDAEPWLFGLLTSRMHMVWTRAVGGKMKTDYRYSNTIVYNNFPVRELTEAEKQQLTDLALRVLDVREYHCEKTLAQLYDPDLMPDNLRVAHQDVDRFVDKLYSERAYETDEERLSDLFAMYERMTAAEAAAAPTKRTRKKKTNG
ncbi:class I SAM-dependent DNA methyltransferase [Corynebacterium sp. 320]|uniref:DNA methyltransferase n=1 Tax=Corynebacterium TaxID=1716 RepID=UPI00125CD378|nr:MULTISPECIES: DNA methyltransferase [Corynebacterium]KAB1504352.1 class I SAM-dependent DNA methyltransferase [Corynebacterium sp. 320]KAB1552548.1 class I SAM-dependent DNA methyltransferase [Corynebacterium sp. 321]KAB3528488.1 class I SAM-dependent DNA methyltransferase [Corynebacterium sp. 250]QNP92029.1 class I SAM-dependent DNA methyltransferase [Corynebacterium zhongnanshanii]